MPLPSKQEMIYSYLLKMFREETFKNGKLPSEIDLAARIGVARRTLRYTLAHLENEGIIIRTNHGTFLKKQHRKTESIPITVLVPCSNYYTASGYWSSYLTHQMISGAMEAAVKAGTYAVTLPITINNDPSQIDLSQFRHLDQDSMVIFNGIEWAPEILSILLELKCRCGIISTRPVQLEIFKENKVPFYNAYLWNYWNCLGDAIEQLVQDGAQKIVYFGRATTDISKRGKAHFIECCNHWNIGFSEDQYVLFDSSLPCQQVLEELGKVYRKMEFDGLIFDSNFYYEMPNIPDFFGVTGIPRSTKMILGVSELLKNPDLPPHTRVLYRPQKRMTTEIADFLFSGKTDQVSHHYKYEFPYLKEIYF